MATGSKLVIVESPTKAKKIGGYLGSEYTVMPRSAIFEILRSRARCRPPTKPNSASSALTWKTDSTVLHRRWQQEENRVRAEKRVEKSRHPVPRNR